MKDYKCGKKPVAGRNPHAAAMIPVVATPVGIAAAPASASAQQFDPDEMEDDEEDEDEET